MMAKFSFLAAVALVLTSCETTTDATSGSSQASVRGGKKSLKVELFQDGASKERRINIRRGTELWRVNGRDAYPSGQIAPRVSKTIAQQLGRSGVFSSVRGPGGSNADLILKGTISEYNASGKVNIKAEKALAAGSIGGATGAALAGVSQRGETTQVFSVVQLRNVRIVDARTGKTVWSGGSFSSSSSQNKTQFLKSDADVLMRRADWELRRAVDKITSRLRSANL